MNRRLSTIAAVSALVAGGFAFNEVRAEDKSASAEAREAADHFEAKAQFPAGIKLKENATEEDRAGVLGTIGSLSEAALTKDGFDDLVERLVDQDRNRIGENGFAERKFDDLNAKVESIRNAWKAKYGADLDLDNEALGKVATICGEIEEPATVAAAWPVAAISEAAADAVTAAAREAGAGAEAEANRKADSNLEKGRDVAIASIPASHGLPGVNLSLLQELGGYRVDLPNSMTGQQLHDSLLKHLSHVSDMPAAEWPADVKDAQLMVTHHIALGIYGVDADADRAGAASDGAAKRDAATD